MKTLIAAAIRCSLVLLVPAAAYAISTQRDLDPISGDWNTAANWTPNGVPNGPSNTATFGLSNTSDVSISANTEVNSIVFTPAATNPYTITAGPGLRLTISGVGIVNNSGRTQNILTSDDASGNTGTIIFSHHASAGSNVSISNKGGSMNFYDGSTAGDAFITNDFSNNSVTGGSTNFFDHSNAGTAHIETNISGGVFFFDHSSAGNVEIQTDLSGDVRFADHSTAGSATLRITDNSFLVFGGNSSAANAFIGATGVIDFFDSSTAGNATISSGGFLSFEGSSKGGTAQIELIPDLDINFFGILDISGHDTPGVTIGSLADNGIFQAAVFLGPNNLTVGSNNLSTTFSGVIQDGGLAGAVGGSLTKIGTGTFTLTGANTYTGNTNVNRGVLQVDGSIASNTFVNQRGTLTGTGTINGNVTNNGRVSPGSAASPGMLTVTDNYTQTQFATLMIQLAGTNAGEFSVLNVLGNANLNGFLDPMLLNGFAPTIGDSFTFLNYASFTGEFSHIKHPFLGNGLQWSVMYEANQAILTVEQHVPDQVSTLLLLTLGLLGLVTFREQLVH